MKVNSSAQLVIAFGFLTFLLSSCNQQIPKDVKETVYEKFDFPDTVIVNKSYDGKIIYHGFLDTITTEVLKKVNHKNRSIIFSLRITSKADYNFDELLKYDLDTFPAISNSIIPISKIKFNSPGIFYIDGVLDDQVFIPKYKDKTGGDDPVREIQNQFRMKHKVVVLNDK